MAFDGIVLHAITYELSGLITGGRVEKIFQPGPSEVVLLIHAAGEHYRLALSADPALAGLHLTRSKKENPTLPPPFCMVLRKYLSGSRISAVYQQGFDRVAVIEFETRSEMGDTEYKRLIVEIMNRQSNIILVNAGGVIHDAIRHADSSVNRFREIMPARPYTPPPGQDKLAPDRVTEAALRERLGAGSEVISKRILNAVSGFSPMLCDAICESVGLEPRTAAGALGEREITEISRKILEICGEIADNRYSPAVIGDGGEFHCLRVCGEVYGVVSAGSTVNLVVDNFFARKTQEASFKKQKAAVMRVVNGNIDKLTAKLAEYRRELDEAEGFEREKQLGELLTAALYSLPETADEVTLTDYYSDGAPELTLPLDGSRTVAANAQLYFKRYRKHKTTCASVGKLYQKARLELDYLENAAAMLANADTPEAVEDLRAELAGEGYAADNGAGGRGSEHDSRTGKPREDNAPWSATLGGRPASKKTLRERAKAARGKQNRGASQQSGAKNAGAGGSGRGGGGTLNGGEPGADAIPDGASRPIVRTSPDGKRVLIGRNSLQNEKLSLRDAAPEDLWFHVKNAPGSHVVLKLKEAGGRGATDADILFAAALAAFYSSQRQGSKVDVDYTTCKNVKKIPGGRPGMVNYYNFSTVTVRPEAL